jgi:hypothetical protein
MKLFNVTYEKMSNPSKGLYWEEHQGYYICNSLDRLYDYIENELHLRIKNIQILDFTKVNRIKELPINKTTSKVLSYGEMLSLLENFSQEDLNQTVTYYDEKDKEYHPVKLELLEIESNQENSTHKTLIINKLGEKYAD